LGRWLVALKRKDKRDELLDAVLTWMSKAGAKMPSQANGRYDPAKKVNKKKAKG